MRTRACSPSFLRALTPAIRLAETPGEGRSGPVDIPTLPAFLRLRRHSRLRPRYTHWFRARFSASGARPDRHPPAGRVQGRNRSYVADDSFLSARSLTPG